MTFSSRITIIAAAMMLAGWTATATGQPETSAGAVMQTAPDESARDAAIDEAMEILQSPSLTPQSRADALATLTQRFPDAGEIWAALGEVRMEIKDDAAALRAFERAVGEDPGLHSAWHWIGVLRRRTGDYDGAIQAFDKAIEAGGSRSQELNQKALTLARIGRMQGAYDTWVQALDSDPDNGALATNAMKAAMTLGDEQAAQRHFRQILAAEDFEETGVLMWGDYLVRKDRREEALRAYESGLDRTPDNARLRYYYAMTLDETGAAEQAITELRRALEAAKATGDRGTESVAMKALFAREDTESYKKLIESQELITGVADVSERRRRQNLEEAIELLNPVIEKYPNFWEPFLMRGTARRQLGLDLPARQDFERVLEIIPDQPNALVNLALLFRDQQNYYNAVEYARRAREAAPNDPLVLINAGLVLANTERCEESREILAKLRQLVPPDTPGEPLRVLEDTIRDACGG